MWDQACLADGLAPRKAVRVGSRVVAQGRHLRAGAAHEDSNRVSDPNGICSRALYLFTTPPNRRYLSLRHNRQGDNAPEYGQAFRHFSDV